MLNIPVSTYVHTCDGLKPLKDINLCEYYLWAVAWVKDGSNDGITFHSNYRSAQNYIAKTHLRTNGWTRPKDKARLVPVSAWLYEWVSEHGDFWAPIDYMYEAEAFCPTFH